MAALMASTWTLSHPSSLLSTRSPRAVYIRKQNWSQGTELWKELPVTREQNRIPARHSSTENISYTSQRTKCIMKVASFPGLPTIQVWDQGYNLACRKVIYSLTPTPTTSHSLHGLYVEESLGMRLRAWDWGWNTDTKQISDHVIAPLFQHNCKEVSVMRRSHKFFVY